MAVSVNFVALTPEEDDLLLEADIQVHIKCLTLSETPFHRIIILKECLKNLIGRLDYTNPLLIDDYIYVCDILDKHKELSQCQI